MPDHCENDNVTLERRITSLEVKLTALDRLMQSQHERALLAVEKSEAKTTEKFESHNEFREQIREERTSYVTRIEMGWLIGIVLMLVFAVVNLFLKTVH
jgi:predicted nucleotide-binding protein (sugar kinase/HSP70/actin superfamily)